MDLPGGSGPFARERYEAGIVSLAGEGGVVLEGRAVAVRAGQIRARRRRA